MWDRVQGLNRVWRRLVADESGQDMVEYGLLVGCVALAMIASMKGLAGELGDFFGQMGAVLTSSV